MSLKSYFQFLDDILYEIYETKGKGKNITEIFDSFYGYSPISDNNLSLNFGNQYPNLQASNIEDFFNKNEALDYEFLKVKQALLYLENEKLIYRITESNFDLTYLGIKKLSKTFFDEYKDEKFQKYFNRTTVTIGLSVSTIGLILKIIFSKY